VSAIAASAFSAWIAVAALSHAAVRPAAKARPTPTPPKILNVVRQQLKRGAVRTYESIEASIVKAYEHAHVPISWTCLQSKTDASDILYLNTAESLDEWTEKVARLTQALAAHPELGKLTDRLQTLGGSPPTSTLTTRREDLAYDRTDVDLRTMKALRLTVFEVTAGHEGQFVRAMRMGGGRTSPWLLYEANEGSTFFLVAPLRSASEAKKGPALPHRLQDLKSVYTVTASTVYLMRPAMSHLEKLPRR